MHRFQVHTEGTEKVRDDRYKEAKKYRRTATNGHKVHTEDANKGCTKIRYKETQDAHRHKYTQKIHSEKRHTATNLRIEETHTDS